MAEHMPFGQRSIRPFAAYEVGQQRPDQMDAESVLSRRLIKSLFSTFTRASEGSRLKLHVSAQSSNLRQPVN
jgi:hypothetical protein